jgi:hypothetical protein
MLPAFRGRAKTEWRDEVGARIADILGRRVLMKALVYPLITHRFELDHFLDAYDTSERAASTQARKVIIGGEPCSRLIPCTESSAARTERRGQYNAN